MLAECFIHTMSVMVCRRKVLDVGLMDKQYKIVHDFEWYIRILSLKGSMSGYIGKPLVYRTIHTNQLISKYEEWQREEHIVTDAFFRKHPAFRKKEKTVRAFRSLYFAHLAFKLNNYRYGFRQLYDAIFVHSFKSTFFLTLFFPVLIPIYIIIGILFHLFTAIFMRIYYIRLILCSHLGVLIIYWQQYIA